MVGGEGVVQGGGTAETTDPSAAQTIRCWRSSCLWFLGVPPNSNIK